MKSLLLAFLLFLELRGIVLVMNQLYALERSVESTLEYHAIICDLCDIQMSGFPDHGYSFFSRPFFAFVHDD